MMDDLKHALAQQAAYLTTPDEAYAYYRERDKERRDLKRRYLAGPLPVCREPVRIHYGPLLIGAWQHFGVIKSDPPAPNRRVR